MAVTASGNLREGSATSATRLSNAAVVGRGNGPLGTPIDPAEVEPGMTIVFEDPMNRDRLVAHRVVRELPGDSLAWETKGDANATSDPLPVHATAVRGRVAWTIPGVGSVVTALRGPQAVVLLVVLPLAILAWTEIAAARRTRTKGKPPVPE